jgi:hypothetical protein
MDLTILDDSTESCQPIIDDFRQQHPECNIKYTYSNVKIALGKKRNMLNAMATGEYIICFDDDDFYPPERVAHTITRLQSTKRQIAGSSRMYIYFSHLGEVYEFGPYGPNHATNGTFGYHRSFLKNHHYEDNASFGEESFFTNKFSCPLVQLDPFKTILCMSHKSNTFDKTKLIGKNNHMTHLSLKSFIKDKTMLATYQKTFFN